MVCKNRGVYGFLGTSWVLITLGPRNTSNCGTRVVRWRTAGLEDRQGFSGSGTAGPRM